MGNLTQIARHLRKNLTPEEKILWNKLKGRQFHNHKFRRQHPIGNRYIVDFYNAENKLVIEVDGGIHNASVAQQEDHDRDGTLEYWGYKVIRVANVEVRQNLSEVLEQIRRELT